MTSVELQNRVQDSQAAGYPAKPSALFRAVMAPMVGASGLAFRSLVGMGGATLVYTQMVLARDVVSSEPLTNARVASLLARCSTVERVPAVVQLAGDSPECLAAATAKLAATRAFMAVELNLGCPQDAAREGHYGSYLAERRDWPLVQRIVSAMAEAAGTASGGTVSVMCKIRLQSCIADTIAFARLLEAAGCAVLTVHGRTRASASRRRVGPADLSAIAAVAAAVSIPVIANGNTCCHADTHANAAATGAVGVMAGEGLLRDPAIFSCREHGCMEELIKGSGCSSEEGRLGPERCEPAASAEANLLRRPSAGSESESRAGAVGGAGIPASSCRHDTAAAASSATAAGAATGSVTYRCSGALLLPPHTPYRAYSLAQLTRLKEDAVRAHRCIARFLRLVKHFHSSAEPHRCCGCPESAIPVATLGHDHHDGGMGATMTMTAAASRSSEPAKSSCVGGPACCIAAASAFVAAEAAPFTAGNMCTSYLAAVGTDADADFVETPGLPLEKLLQHVGYMLGKSGHGPAVQYRFRGGFAAGELRHLLTPAGLRQLQLHLATHCGPVIPGVRPTGYEPEAAPRPADYHDHREDGADGISDVRTDHEGGAESGLRLRAHSVTVTAACHPVLSTVARLVDSVFASLSALLDSLPDGSEACAATASSGELA